jgi:glycosyltransferase involved in cell wall biosynthesis
MAAMRVLHVLDKFSVDGSKIHGPARQLTYRLPHYDPARCAMLIVSLRGEEPAAEWLRRHGLEVVCLGRGKFDPRALADLCRLIRRRRIELLHLSGYAAWVFGRLAGRLTGIPVIVQEHFVAPRVPWYQRVADWMLRDVQAGAIAVSASVQQFMAEQRFIRRTPIEVIGNGVPLERLRSPSPQDVQALRQRLNVPADAAVVGIVGRLAEQKGHADFLRAARIIAARVPQAVFVIVGDGPLRAALERQARELGLSGRVRFAGYQPDVLPALALFNVSVISSIYGEGFCSVGIESFAAGTPVVMTDIAAVPGTYEHGRNALIVPRHQPEALAEAVVSCLTRPALAAALVRAGERTLPACDSRSVAERYLAAYERALGRRRAAAPRVCLLTGSFHPMVGGGETYARNIARRLSASGVPVFVLTRRALASSPRAERADGVDVIRVGPSGAVRFGKYLMIPSVMRELVRRRTDFDVLLVSNFRALGPAAVLAAKWLRKPCVLRAGVCGEFSGSYVAADGLSSRRALSWLRGPLALRRRLLASADGFVSNCREITEEFRQGGAPEAKIAYLPGGVDTEKFRPANAEERAALRARLTLPESGFLIGYAGKLNRGKGIEHLLAALPGIRNQHPDAHLVLIGGGAHQFLSYEAELRSQAQRLSLEPAVTFTGYVDAVPDYLRALDVFVLPTEHEALPNALMEAMATGLPCVASRVGGIPDLIEDGVSGILVPAADPAALEQALRRLKEEPALARRLGEGARAAMERRFSLEQLARRHAELLARIAGHGDGGSEENGAH